MLTSYAFRFKTSICNKKAIIDFTFVYPLYKEKINIIYRIFYMAAFWAFVAFSQHYFYLIFIYFVMYIIDFYLY